MANFISNDISRKAILDFLFNSKKFTSDAHTLIVYHKGEIKARVALEPYSCDYKAQLFSLSKSFSSTAIGLLVDDGLISLEDRFVDIFADRAPEKIGKKMSRLKVWHILAMNTGHKACHMGEIKNEPDIVKAFMSIEPEYEPGTHFAYNNSGTYMLSEIVTKVTGMTMMDFLSYRLFEPLDITDIRWDTFKSGRNQAAVGLHASADDLMKLGVLYLNKGVYNGKRILSEEWVAAATSIHSNNSNNGTEDWTSGYGFQFWMNAREGYRGDGAFGQLVVVLPERDMVVVEQSYTMNMQKQMDAVYELVDNLYSKDNTSEKEFETGILALNAPQKTDVFDADFGAIYRCEDNPCRITMLRLEKEDDNIVIHFSTGEKWQRINCGFGKHLESNIYIEKFKPTLDTLVRTDREEHVRLASYYVAEKNAMRVYIRYLNNPYTDRMKLELKGNKLTLTLGEKDIRYEIKAKKLPR